MDMSMRTRSTGGVLEGLNRLRPILYDARGVTEKLYHWTNNHLVDRLVLGNQYSKPVG